MNIAIAHDMDLIKEIVTAPGMWESMAEDGVTPDQFVAENTPFSFWLLATVSDKVCGIILVNVETSISFKVHPHMLKEFAGKGYLMIKELFRWFLRETTDLSNKICITTPTFNKAGYKLAVKLGFKDEGLSRQSYKKNGEIFDQYILGITRDEVKEVVRCQHS